MMLAGLAEQGSTESFSVVQDFRFRRNKGSSSRLEETGDFGCYRIDDFVVSETCMYHMKKKMDAPSPREVQKSKQLHLNDLDSRLKETK
jgi:hypothetical protein